MDNFLGLEKKYSDLAFAKYCLLQVPYEKTTTYGKGAANGPAAVIAASSQVELYDEELGIEAYKHGIATESVPDLSGHLDAEESLKRIEETATRFIAQDKLLIGVGGEHSVTLPLVQAHRKRYRDFSVLQLDAHADLRMEYLGSKFNHACVMARVSEHTSCVGVGIRALSGEEAEYIRRERYPIWFAHQIQVEDDWQNRVLEKLKKKVYITVDVDCFDPSLMPATGTPEPGGLFWWETLRFLRRVFHEREVIGFDVVELAPIKGLHAPDFLVARLIYKMIGYHVVGEGTAT